MQHNLTGLLVEPAVSEHRPIRGIFLYSHGTKAPGDPALSWLGGPLSDVAALLALAHRGQDRGRAAPLRRSRKAPAAKAAQASEAVSPQTLKIFENYQSFE